MSYKELRVKIIIIASLVIISGILFYFYLNREEDSSEISGDKRTEKKLSEEELKKKIPTEIDTLLFSFGIKKEWIKEAKSDKKSEKQNTDLWFAKEVSIPTDLNTIEVTTNLTNLFRYFGMESYINEDPKTKNINADVFLKIDSLRKGIGNIKLIYSDKIKRDASDICLVINNITDFKSSDLNDVVNSTENFSIVLPLTNDKSDVQATVLNSKKDYLLKFSLGNEDDVEADFKSGQENIKDWKSKIKSIAYEFTKAGGVILENPVHDNIFEGKVIDEFEKYKMNTYKDTLLMKFASTNIDEKKVYDLFAHIIERTKKGYASNFYILNLSPAEFLFLDKEIANLKRRGYKFYSFKDLMKKINTKNTDTNASDDKKNTPDSLTTTPKAVKKKK